MEVINFLHMSCSLCHLLYASGLSLISSPSSFFLFYCSEILLINKSLNSCVNLSPSIACVSIQAISYESRLKVPVLLVYRRRCEVRPIDSESWSPAQEARGHPLALSILAWLSRGAVRPQGVGPSPRSTRLPLSRPLPPSERSSPSWSESRRLRLIRNHFARRPAMHLLRTDRLTVTRAHDRLRQSPRCEARLSRLVHCFTVLVLSYSRNVAVASWAFFWSCRVSTILKLILRFRDTLRKHCWLQVRCSSWLNGYMYAMSYDCVNAVKSHVMYTSLIHSRDAFDRQCRWCVCACDWWDRWECPTTESEPQWDWPLYLKSTDFRDSKYRSVLTL